MHPARKLVVFGIIAGAFVLLRPVRAADLNSVMQRLDAAAKDFHTTTANVEFDTIATEPISDVDVRTGVAYYERKGASFQMAAHLNQHDGHSADKTYVFSGGVLKESDTGKAADVKTYTQAGKYESYLILGFGASGTQLQEKWDVKYLGSEKIDGVMTDKLELVAKDSTVRKNIPKVTIWLDTSRAVSLKQVFDEGQGESYVCHYTDIKVNQSLPSSAFSFEK